MDLVIDANIVFASLIKPNVTYRLLFTDSFRLFAPEFLLFEFEKHKEAIIDKSEETSADFFHLLDILKRRIEIVPFEEFNAYVAEAEKITPDPDDVAYFALAMKLGCAIWSNDKNLKRQDRISVYQTHDLLTML